MSTVEEFSKKVSALVATITDGRKNGDVNDAQWARLTELANDVNYAVDRFNKGEGGQMAADSALATLETAVKALLGASATTGGTPVPASAAPTPPTTPTAPPSGTSKWAPSQATPPAAPAPAPDLTQVKQEITSAVKQGIIDLLKPMAEVLPSDANGFVPVASKAEVNDHETRITQLEKAGFDWLVAAFVATGTAIVAYIVMTQGQYSDIVKTVASLAIGAFVGWIVGAFWAGIKSRRQERSSRNAA